MRELTVAQAPTAAVDQATGPDAKPGWFGRFTEAVEADAVHRVRERLTERFVGRYTGDYVAHVTEQVHRQFADARIRLFVPILVERQARLVLERGR